MFDEKVMCVISSACRLALKLLEHHPDTKYIPKLSRKIRVFSLNWGNNILL